jgi:hypothetical protein
MGKLWFVFLLCGGSCLAQGHFERMPYNNPGGTCELGSGLGGIPMVMDYNGDGKLDILLSCNDVPYNGTYYYENAGGDIFKRGRRIASGMGTPVAGPGLGNKLLVTVPGAVILDFLTNGFANSIPLKGVPINLSPSIKGHGNSWRFADFDGDGRDDIVIGVGDWSKYGWANAYNAQGQWTNDTLHGFVFWAKNLGSGQLTDAAKLRANDWGKPEQVMLADGKPLDVFGNPMPMVADFDGDGDLDIICGSFLDTFTFFENTGTRTAPKYAPGRKLMNESGGMLRMDLQMITPTVADWNGDGRPDIISGEEDGTVSFIENLGRKQGGLPAFRAPRKFRQEMDAVKFGVLSTPFGCDWDGDGDWDLLAGDSAGYIAFIENLSGPGVASPKWAEPVKLAAGGKVIRFQAGPNGSIQGPAEAKWGYSVLTVADWDGDGLLDIMANSILGNVVWFRNVGTRTKPALAAAQPVEVEWDGAQPALAWGWRKPQGKALLTQWRTTPVMNDWNADGLVDLVMLDQEGYLVFFERAVREGKRVLLSPKRVFGYPSGNPFRPSSGTAGSSGRRKICFTDWDGDGKADILMNAFNIECWKQIGVKDGKKAFSFAGKLDMDTRLQGHSTCPTVVDFDNDGLLDLVVGAEDGHFYTFRNPRAVKAVPPPERVFFEEPLRFLGQDRIFLADSADLIPADADFSVSVDIRTHERKGLRCVFTDKTLQLGTCGFVLSLNSAAVGKAAWIINGTTLLSKTDVTDGFWHTLAVTREKSRYRLFVDGRFEAEATRAVPLEVTDLWAVGASVGPKPANGFDGLLRNVKIKQGIKQ